MKTEYRIVQEPSGPRAAADLAQQVNELIEGGWTPYGPLVVMGTAWLYQPMMRKALP